MNFETAIAGSILAIGIALALAIGAGVTIGIVKLFDLVIRLEHKKEIGKAERKGYDKGYATARHLEEKEDL